MIKSSDLVSALGRQEVAAALRIEPSAVSNAVKREKFPSSWFVVMKALADIKGIDCPMYLFSFVEHVRDRRAAQGEENHTGGANVSR